MPKLSELRKLLDQDQRIREDFISTLASFFERHHIEVSVEDLAGVDDIVGYLFSLPPNTISTDPGTR